MEEGGMWHLFQQLWGDVSAKHPQSRTKQDKASSELSPCRVWGRAASAEQEGQGSQDLVVSLLLGKLQR